MTYRHTISHHTPRCKTKLDVLPFILLQVLCGCYGFPEIRTVSYLRTSNHNIGFVISFYCPLKEAFACTTMSTKVGETTPAKPHLYGASRMSGVEPVSHKCMRKVGRGQLIIQQYREQVNTWKGINYEHNAHKNNSCVLVVHAYYV